MASILSPRNFYIALFIFFFNIASPHAQTIPVNGASSHDFTHIGEFMTNYMDAHGVTAATLEIRKKNGDVLLHQGYGWLDQGETKQTQTDSMMRIMSITKNIVHMAILKLAQDSAISLDAKAFCLRNETPSGTGCLLRVTPAGNDGIPDPNADDITVRHLLGHAAGWNESTADTNGVYEPAGGSVKVAAILNVQTPPTYQQLINYQLDQALDYIPGTQSQYSNFGYVVLGHIIEKYSGSGFMQYIHERFTDGLNVARPDMGLGAELVAYRNPREPRYVDRAGVLMQNLFDPAGPKVPWPDGGFLLGRAAGAGGIISTTSALLDYMSGYWLFNPGPRAPHEGHEWIAGGGGPGSAAIAVQNSPLPGFVTQADWAVMLNTNPMDGSLHQQLRARIANTLSKNVTIGGIESTGASEQFFTLHVPQNFQNLEFRTQGGGGDIDLYVRLGSRPTTSDYDCRSINTGNTSRSCSIPNPASGTYYAMLRGNSAFTGVSVSGNYEIIDCTVDYSVTSTWSTGFQARITVTNHGDTNINGYTLRWSPGAGESFNGGWNAIFNTSGATITASNSPTQWNGVIAANGGAVTFWFEGNDTSLPPAAITNFMLNGAACN